MPDKNKIRLGVQGFKVPANILDLLRSAATVRGLSITSMARMVIMENVARYVPTQVVLDMAAQETEVKNAAE